MIRYGENLTNFNKIFEKQLKNFGLDGVAWRFRYAKDDEAGFCDYEKNFITVCRNGGERISRFRFMTIARHELFHYKYRNSGINKEIFASMSEIVFNF